MDAGFNHLHHCLLSAALTYRIASVYFLSCWACGYVKFWLDAGQLARVSVYLLQLQLTWSASWVSHLASEILIRKQIFTNHAQF